MSSGRKRKDTPTQHGWRLHWLILELVEDLGSQAEVSRQTSLEPQYVNAFRNLESSGVKGVSADIIQTLVDKLGVDPMFFFEAWRPGERRSYKLYSLENRKISTDNKALEKRVIALESRLDEMMDLLRNARGEGPKPINVTRKTRDAG